LGLSVSGNDKKPTGGGLKPFLDYFSQFKKRNGKMQELFCPREIFFGGPKPGGGEKPLGRSGGSGFFQLAHDGILVPGAHMTEDFLACFVEGDQSGNKNDPYPCCADKNSMISFRI
jgi:hypothetical protein